ncbi:MAG TPA: hypothetical protein VIW47_05705 [Nitrospiraceae bacterium]|jgi:hypothetical protein
MDSPVNSTKVIIKAHSRSGLWQAEKTTIQIHRNATVEEYLIPAPQDVFESEDFELVKEHALQNALAWINSEDGPGNLCGEIQMEIETVIEQ